MDFERIRREIARHDPDLPVDRAFTPPASWYLDPEIFALERRAVFGASWLVADRAENVHAPGSYLAGWAGGEPFVITRDQHGELRAFYNVCRHHAAIIATGTGCAEALVCPYHGWRYDLDGTLRKAPRLGAIRDFDVSRHGLVPMRVAEWQGLVLIHMGAPETGPEHDLAELGRRLDATGTAALRHVTRKSYDLACNWKVFVDNYLDGGYHVACAHPGLAAQLDLHGYRTELFERYSIQSCPGAAAADNDSGNHDAGGGLRGRIGQQALYAWLYPNYMINRYGPAMDTNLVIPLSVDRTRVIFDFYFDSGVSDDFISRSLASADATQAEDIEICESVQRGVESRAYDRGRLAPGLEMAEHHFHGLLARDLGRALDQAR